MTPTTAAPVTRPSAQPTPSKYNSALTSNPTPSFTNPADDIPELDDTAALQLTERPPLSFENWLIRMTRRVKTLLRDHSLFDNIPSTFTPEQIRYIVNLRITLIVYVYESMPTPRTTTLNSWLIRAAHADPKVAAAVLRLYCNPNPTPPQ